MSSHGNGLYPLSLSLISLMVSVDIKHHVYLLLSLCQTLRYQRCKPKRSRKMAAITSGLSDNLFFLLSSSSFFFFFFFFFFQHWSTKDVHLFFSVARSCLPILKRQNCTICCSVVLPPPPPPPPPFSKILDFPRRWQMVDWVLNTSYYYYYCCLFWTLQTSTIAWW